MAEKQPVTPETEHAVQLRARLGEILLLHSPNATSDLFEDDPKLLAAFEALHANNSIQGPIQIDQTTRLIRIQTYEETDFDQGFIRALDTCQGLMKHYLEPQKLIRQSLGNAQVEELVLDDQGLPAELEQGRIAGFRWVLGIDKTLPERYEANKPTPKT
jgi:hypothetical protein